MKKAFDDSFLPPLPKKSTSTGNEVLKNEVTVLPKRLDNMSMSTVLKRSDDKILPAHKLNPAMAIISEVSNLITSLADAYTQISVEKQRTEQIYEQSSAFKIQQYEMTKRTKIEQKEETKRVKIQVELEISKLEQQWKIEEKNIDLQLKTLEQSERNNAAFILKTEETIGKCLEHLEALMKQSKLELSNGIYNSELQNKITSITTQIHSILKSLQGV